ncbi:tyrosine-protein kinase family protein [Seongchinamella sediminis]|uniref:non-specific protein-tyrosine kinase n=1 Tax=Seongchinamella sediminis TaxID=2283635 RepID=A0A3L7DVX1_9GAMM|nr:XrtA-associated tyrosine autokinase [Seongchinamella sediminis]RLQ20750.1 tyrosine-protein kinase family protein [Seongchinamella sediminis]
MSIIEKAVDSLRGQNRSSDEGEAEGYLSSEQASDTVQKAAMAQSVDRQEQFVQQGEETLSAASGNHREQVEIPFDKLQELGYLTPAVPRSGVAEEYRRIKRPLLMNIAGRSAAPIENANLIMVTSALQGDGKTFSSINLALSIAMEKDKTVLFVDADTAKADAGRVLGVPPGSPGLIDVLENKGVELADVILPTNVEKLRIIPAGNINAHSNELLASNAMRRLMLELSERYPDRVVVFDSPPLLLTTEAGVLANLMGQIVFVVGAQGTPQHAVTKAMEHIGQDKAVGMLLNKARQHRGLFNYGYGYGYRYAYRQYGEGSRDRDPVAGE